MLNELDKEIIAFINTISFKGGEGSGNYGHEGRPGEVGGSAPGGGGGSSTGMKVSNSTKDDIAKSKQGWRKYYKENKDSDTDERMSDSLHILDVAMDNYNSDMKISSIRTDRGLEGFIVSSEYEYESVIQTLASAPWNQTTQKERLSGVGTTLLQNSVKKSYKNGIRRIRLKPLEGAVNYYKKIGFVNDRKNKGHMVLVGSNLDNFAKEN